MMKSEFIERTKYEPTAEEYHYIEESYYEFDGDKDQFCKQWLKDKKSGAWAKEYRLRKMVDDTKAEMQKKIDEQEENLEWYREHYSKVREERDQLKAKVEAVAEAIR